MSHATRSTRILAVALLATTCLLTLAPVAEAGRFKRGHRHHRAPSRVVVYRSSPAPVLAGFVGGLIIGAAYARPTPVVHTVAYRPAPRYRYWDPYCDTWFVSLSSSREHSHFHEHPQIVKVFDHDGGACLRTMQWSAGAWYDI